MGASSKQCSLALRFAPWRDADSSQTRDCRLRPSVTTGRLGVEGVDLAFDVPLGIWPDGVVTLTKTRQRVRFDPPEARAARWRQIPVHQLCRGTTKGADVAALTHQCFIRT